MVVEILDLVGYSCGSTAVWWVGVVLRSTRTVTVAIYMDLARRHTHPTATPSLVVSEVVVQCTAVRGSMYSATTIQRTSLVLYF